MRRLVEHAGRIDEDEVDRERRPFDAPQRGDLRLDVAAEDVHRDRVADTEIEVTGELGIEGDELRARVIRRPPLARHDAGADRLGRRVGDAAVAFDRPARLGRHLDLAERRVADLDDAAAQRRHLLDLARAFDAFDGLLELGHLVRLDVDEEKGRRIVRHALGDLFAEIAFDQRRRHQHREAEPQRQHDDGRRCAGTMEIGESETQRGDLRLARAGRERHDAAREQREGDEGRNRAAHEDRGDAAVVGRPDGEGGECQRRYADHERVAPAEAILLHDGAAHQRRGRHGACADQGHQGEHQRHQQAEDGGNQQRLCIDRDARAHRKHVGDQRLREIRKCRADHDTGHDADQRQHRELQEIGREDEPCGAPRHFSVAMVRTRAPRKDEIALPTPTPPTKSEARPIRPMNCVSRSSQKRMPPPASARPRSRQPTSGYLALSSLMTRTVVLPGREAQAIFPREKTAGLHEARLGQRLERKHEPRAEAREGVEPAVGLAGDDAANLDGDLADAHSVAQRRCSCGGVLRPRQRRPRRVASVAPLGQRVGERKTVLQLDLSVERVRALYGLELHQCRLRIGLHRAGHGAAVDPAHELGPWSADDRAARSRSRDRAARSRRRRPGSRAHRREAPLPPRG